MSYESLTVLIPSHSLEDLPLDLPDTQAEGLLNGFAALWHPALITAAGRLPRWERADDPPALSPKSLVIVPTVSRDWLACQWLDDSEESGANIIADVANRTELLDRCLKPLDVPDRLNPDVAADFLALGHCYLQMELLTRQMRYFSELDEARLEANTLKAARATLAGDETAARSHLRDCFEMLLESRERFYPVDCYLLDLCLLTPETADDCWRKLAASDSVVNYLATAADLQSLAAEHSETLREMASRWRDGRQELIGGELTEEASALLPLDASIGRFHSGLDVFKKLFDRRPTVWGRRKFGVGPQLPQLLDKLGYHAALHFVMDDGLYPDEEHGRFRWEGCDGSVIDATSRIPLAGDSASSFLRFPLRMSESMDYDHSAMVQFARWPDLHSPWLDDFHRIHRYAPVLGRFVTYSDLFRSTDTPGRLTKFKTADYLSPHLLQSVAREEPDPISRYADAWAKHHRLEELTWLSGLAILIAGRRFDAGPSGELFDGAGDEYTETESAAMIDDRRRAARTDLAGLIIGDQGPSPGCLVLNPCSFSRRVVVDWPKGVGAAATCDAVIARHADDEGRSLVVEVPPCGFVWLPCAPHPPAAPGTQKSKIPLAEDDLLRNEFFEIGVSPETGGVAALKTYGLGPNRMSQQVAFRFRHERIYHVGEGDDTESVRTLYSFMRRSSARILSSGPGRGAIESRGTLTDPQTEELLAEYRQVVTVRRGRPIVEIDLELDVHKQPEGDPWSNYFACRWAWSNADAGLTASVHEGAQPVGAERFEAPHYVEIADGDLRTTILPHGLPFHRKSGPRMLDTLLIVAGESRRRWRFVITVDEAYPMERARDCLMPVQPVPLKTGPVSQSSGWFFHVDALNVQITRLMPLMPPPGEHSDGAAQAIAAGTGIRLRETEGRHRTVRLRCFRTPASARQRDLLGKTISQLAIDGDTVLVEVTAYEICDVEVTFS